MATIGRTSGGGDLVDYSVGVGYSTKRLNIGLKLKGTDARGAQKITTKIFNNEPRLTLTLVTTFPWTSDQPLVPRDLVA